MKYAKFEKINLKSHPELDERWLQDRIAEDPSVLGLGDVILKDKERTQPRAGRLDILLQDIESTKRYEVEVQLGSSDEAHIIRAIEYWDIERKRYPQYEHTAVLVAEDITSRFLNVISLFNGVIPLIAIQVRALKLGNEVGLDFTTVLDYVPLGLVDDDEGTTETADRGYWESRSSKATLEIVDHFLKTVKKLDPKLELKYNKPYIGLSKNGKSSNFVSFRPARNFAVMELRLDESASLQDSMEKAGLDVIKYEKRWGRYHVRIRPQAAEGANAILEEAISQAYQKFKGE